jgi:hypothetical protein
MSEKENVQRGLAPSVGLGADFQTAPYDQLCGCVAVLVPSAANHAYQKNGKEVVNHEMTRMLIEQGKHQRIVDASCEKCGGTGIAPNEKN